MRRQAKHCMCGFDPPMFCSDLAAALVEEAEGVGLSVNSAITSQRPGADTMTVLADQDHPVMKFS